MSNERGWERPFFNNLADKPENIAHRGGMEEYPEETVEAFDYAIEVGVDALEMDVHSTKDGVLVLMHDAKIDRTTDKTGRIDAYNWDKLKEFDAGYWWTKDGETYPHRGKGYKIPRLESVFERFLNTRMVIELKDSKPSLIKSLADLIRRQGMTDKILIASFSHSALKDFRAGCPEVATSASTIELAKFIFVDSIISKSEKTPAFDAVQVGIRYKNIPIPFINSKTIAAARRLNIPIQAWTVNREDDMRKMIVAGVDGIITDNPKMLSDIKKTVEV